MTSPKTKKSLFAWYFKSNLLMRILIGLALGVVAGLCFGEHILWVSPFGTLFVRLLTMIVIPLVIATLIVGAASVSPAHLGKAGIKIMMFYLITSGFAVTLGLLMANLLNPGDGLQLSQGAEATVHKISETPTLVDTALSIVPTNIFAAVAGGDMLAIIFFTLLFGLGLSFLRASEDERLKTAGDQIFRFFDGISEIIQLMVRWVLQYAPIGVFALIAVVFAKQEASIISSLGLVLATAYSGFLIQIFVVYSLLLMATRLPIKPFFQKGKEAILTAFVTRSSGGTLPVSLKSADSLGVNRSVSSFTLPLGATINMDGTAIYQGVCIFFIASAVGMPLSFDQQITVVITSILASIGTAGAPGSGVIMLMIVMKSVGLDIDQDPIVMAAYALILGLDALLDMGRTAVNVTGDIAGTVIVAKHEKEFDFDKYKNPVDPLQLKE